MKEMKEMKEMGNMLRMLQTIDAFFPIGAFTLSNGLEDYVAAERISSTADLEEYLTGFLQIFPYNDLGIAALAWQYGAGQSEAEQSEAEQSETEQSETEQSEAERNRENIIRLDGLVNAMKGAREARTGSIRLCSRYLKAREAMEDCRGLLGWYQEKIREKAAVGFYPIAVGLYGASIGMDQAQVLAMYGYSAISAIVNNGVKLVPLSQMEGQRALLRQMDRLEEAVRQAMEVTEDDLGVSGAGYEIHAMNHEYLYSRQYMS